MKAKRIAQLLPVFSLLPNSVNTPSFTADNKTFDGQKAIPTSISSQATTSLDPLQS